MDRIFRPCGLLLPKDCDMGKWSVVACDQFSSQPEYWDALDKSIGNAPSTLRLMLPEAYLDAEKEIEQAERINAKMREYLDAGVFLELPDSYVYVERTLAGGAVRRGLVGALDLEAYDYSQDSSTPIRATEGTIESRLPPRVRVRRSAPLEMPHIMVFVDDEENRLLGQLARRRDNLPKLYDFELSCGGGHIRGWQVTGAEAQAVDAAIDKLSDAETLSGKYGDAAPVVFAMGDGNHSLATAKKCWEELKPTLSESERLTHPARFGLVELVNIHDEAITFEPIHRVIFGTDTDEIIDGAGEFWSRRCGAPGREHRIRLVCGDREADLYVPGLTIGELIGSAEDFCQSWAADRGGRVDYIHNDDTAESMGRRENCAAILLPKMEKDELFPSIIRSGPFPKKSFSIGHAEDKRYYLECRSLLSLKGK